MVDRVVQNDPVATVSFIDKERSVEPTDSTSQPGITHVALSIGDLDRILVEVIGKSQDYADSMTLNDKQNFIRVAIDEGDIDSVDLLPDAIEDADDPGSQISPYGTVWIAGTSGDTFQTPGDGTWTQINTP